jgi:hypothetical protein
LSSSTPSEPKQVQDEHRAANQRHTAAERDELPHEHQGSQTQNGTPQDWRKPEKAIKKGEFLRTTGFSPSF